MKGSRVSKTATEGVVVLQEEEKRLRAGTRKEAVFKVLREAGSEGRTVLQIAEEARQRGIRDFADSERKLLQLV